MNIFFQCFKALEAFSSPFYFLSVLLFLSMLKRRKEPVKYIIICGFSIVYFAFYQLSVRNPDAARWLSRLNHPLFFTLVILIWPAFFLPRKRWYPFFLLIPAIFIVLSIAEVARQYRLAPLNTGFIWFPMRPESFITALVSFLVITQYFVKLNGFRKVMRVTFFIALIYGGFAFRQSYTDYKEALARRAVNTPQKILLLSETTPVLKYDNQLIYIPGAPCRFSSDGGYVQGCVMELLQRTMQVKFEDVISGSPTDVALFAMALAALLFTIILLYIGARLWCGWVCPLSTLGDIFDFIRRRLGLPHFKPSRPVKLTLLISGISLSSFSLLLAKAYTYIDQDGKFLGCKIPVYPFCKICPGQQVCPVAAKGIAGYPALPGMEWLFGYFKVFALALLFLFILAFMSARRLWCRFCPMGMIGGLFNKGALVSLKKNPLKCNGCGVCSEVCPAHIQSVGKEMGKEGGFLDSSLDVSSFDCIYCLRCVDHCPKDGCLSMEFCGNKIAESKYKI